MAISSIVARGFGSFGSAVLIPTRGYGTGVAASLPILGGLFSPARTHIQYRPPSKPLVAKIYGKLPQLELRPIRTTVRLILPDEPPTVLDVPPLDFRIERRIELHHPVIQFRASYRVIIPDDDEIVEVMALLSQCGEIDAADARLIEMALLDSPDDAKLTEWAMSQI